MNPDVLCLRPDQSATAAARALAASGVSGAPVVDDDGRVVGVVTQNDLVRHSADPRSASESGQFYTDLEEYRDLRGMRPDRSGTPLEKVMNRPVYTVDRDASVAIAANIMRERHVHRLFVVDRGRLVGVLSALDLMRVVEESC
jgi:CBS domain-containing protein